jgi:hypothetical protein
MTLDPQTINQVLAHLKAAEASLTTANHFASGTEPKITAVLDITRQLLKALHHSTKVTP